MNLPDMFRVRQRFASGRIDDVGAALRAELGECGVPVRPGARIAVAVGSRGIANLPLVVRGVVEWIRERGGVPFVVPAMGSHGGATAEGQRRTLAGYGITEAGIGAPIDASMESIEIAPGAFVGRAANESDGIVLVNRVKPHTSFHGRYESGLVKMMAVGLGHREAATAVHRGGVGRLAEAVAATAGAILGAGKILLGVALVENAYEETMLVRAVAAREIPVREPEWLALARAHMPGLPVADLDVLVVDEIGKDISGTGLDTNVIGRLRIAGQPEPGSPRIRRILVRDLSQASPASAYGIGLADVTTKRLCERADWAATEANVVATGFTERGRVPAVAGTDEEALAIALEACAPAAAGDARIARIRSTLHLAHLLVSRPVLDEIRGRPAIEILGPAALFADAL